MARFRQFLSFACIGAAAFVVDVAVLHAAMHFGGLNFYAGRAVSWLSAATFTWYLNRRLTFREAATDSAAAQWLKFLVANSLGGALNYAIYAACIATSPVARAWPVLAVGAGSIGGLFVNFVLSSRFVFQRAKPDRPSAR